MQDFFALMQIPVSCEPDMATLERQYRLLQGQWHPDRFAGASQTEKTAALQKTSLLNDAYATLKEPLSRAAHILQLQGEDVESHSQDQLDQAFLLSQMELRDDMADAVDAGNVEALDALLAKANAQRDGFWAEFRDAVQAGDYAQARKAFYKLQFYRRLLEELQAAADRLLDY